MKRLKKLLPKITALILSIMLLTACSQSEVEAPAKEIGDYIDLWTTYGITKVLQNRRTEADESYYDLGSTLRISMMRDETEGGQIVLSAKRNVSSYSVEAAELSDGNGNVISVDSIEIFHSKYVEITSKTRYNENMAFRIGDRIPDMLLDMDIAEKYGENKINKGENQSVYVDITTTPETVAGTYTGNFKLTVDGLVQLIPVEVTVWDIYHEGKSDFQTVFEAYTNKIVMGEYNCTEEIFDSYARFAMKYNVNLFPVKGDYTAYFETELEEYFQSDRYNTIALPVFSVTQDFYTFGSDGKTTGSAQSTIDTIIKLVKMSTPENPYIEYAVCYHTGMDEADAWTYRWTEAERIYGAGGEVEQLLKETVRQLEEQGVLDGMTSDFAERVKHAVMYMPQILTTVSFTDEAVGKFETAVFCPLIQNFNDAVQVGRYNEAAEKYNDGELWTYTCNATVYPHQSFHTDDYNIGTRVAGWMYKDYGINGYLYWAVDQYFGAHTDDYVDVYDEPNKAAYANGEGMLFYPGLKYGSESPFPSIRLVSFRDSVDDYDMICVLEDLLNKYTEQYGIDPIDVNDYIDDLYASMYNGTDYYDDDCLVYRAREELVRRILALQEDGVLVRSNYTASGNEVTVYSVDSALSLNGTTVNGVALGDGAIGYRYTVDASTVTDGKLAIKGSASEWTYVVREICALDAANATGTEGSSVTAEGDTWHITAASVDRGDSLANKRYKPYVQFELKAPTDFYSLAFAVENTSDRAIGVDVLLVYSDGVTKSVGGFYIGIGVTDEVRLFIGQESEIDLSRVAYVRFVFDNTVQNGSGEQELFGTYTFDIVGMVYDKK